MSATATWGAELVQIQAGTEVQKRQLIGESESFIAGKGRVFVHLTVASAAAESVTLVWKRTRTGAVSREVWRISMKVGKSPRWRTWARRTMREGDIGEWEVEVLDAVGASLGSTQFSVGPDDEAPRAVATPFEDERGC